MLPKNKNESNPESQIPVILQSEPTKRGHESEIENPFSKMEESGSKESKSEEESGRESNEREITSTCCDSSIEQSTSRTTAAKIEENSSGRERLKRHRVEIAGRVWIPEMWGQENLLKDWIDCTAFDATLMNSSIMSARASLVEEARRANNSRFRLENSC